MEEHHNRKEEKRNINDGVEEKRSDFMNNKVAKAGMAVGIFLGAAIVA